MIAGSLLGGSVVDAIDRRRLLMVTQTLMAGCCAGLAVNADLGTSLWPLFVLPARPALARSSSWPCPTLRGRLSGLQIAVVTGGPRVGDLEAGVVAAGFGDTVSVVSGGLACIAGALVLARLMPGFRHQRTPAVMETRVTRGAPSEQG